MLKDNPMLPYYPVAQIENAPVRSLLLISVDIFFGPYGICHRLQAKAKLKTDIPQLVIHCIYMTNTQNLDH